MQCVCIQNQRNLYVPNCAEEGIGLGAKPGASHDRIHRPCRFAQRIKGLFHTDQLQWPFGKIRPAHIDLAAAGLECGQTSQRTGPLHSAPPAEHEHTAMGAFMSAGCTLQAWQNAFVDQIACWSDMPVRIFAAQIVKI